MQTRQDEIAAKLLEGLSLDNGVQFHPTAAQVERLTNGVREMLLDGCAFTAEDISDMIAGEEFEMEERFSCYVGWGTVNSTLRDIFEGD